MLSSLLVFERKDSLLYQFVADTLLYFSHHIMFDLFCLPESNLAPREGVEMLWLERLYETGAI